MIQALVLSESYDREILLSWVDCLSCNIITNQFPYPASRSEPEEENNNKNQRTSSGEQPEIIQEVNNESEYCAVKTIDVIKVI